MTQRAVTRSVTSRPRSRRRARSASGSIRWGVCGTDLHIHNGDFNARFPLIPGHELVGTVDALGDGVDRFSLGEQVTVNPNILRAL